MLTDLQKKSIAKMKSHIRRQNRNNTERQGLYKDTHTGSKCVVGALLSDAQLNKIIKKGYNGVELYRIKGLVDIKKTTGFTSEQLWPIQDAYDGGASVEDVVQLIAETLMIGD